MVSWLLEFYGMENWHRIVFSRILGKGNWHRIVFSELYGKEIWREVGFFQNYQENMELRGKGDFIIVRIKIESKGEGKWQKLKIIY